MLSLSCFAVISEGSPNDACEIVLGFFNFILYHFILYCSALIAEDKEPIECIVSIHSNIIGHTNLPEVNISLIWIVVAI